MAMDLSKFHTAALVALVVICYKNSLNGELVFDDLPAIRDNRDIRPHTPLSNLLQNDFWGTPIRKEKSHKSYRPLTVLSFRLNYAVHGLHPFGYHFVNLLLHSCVCILFYKLCLMFLPVTSSLVSSALFAVHPIHTEAVSGIVGRAELLSAVAFLGALLFYIQNRYQNKNSAWRDCCVSSVLAVLGLLCKEQGVTALAICCAYELSLSKNLGHVQSIRHLMLGRGVVTPWLRDKILRLFLLSSFLVVIIFFRWRHMGHKVPVFSRFDNPVAVSATPTRQLTYNYLLSVNTWLLLFPWHLCCDWTMSTIPLVTSIWDIRNVATLFLYAGVFHIVRSLFKMEEDARMAAVMGLSLLVFPFLPASNLFFPVGFVVAERILYIPSMGFCILVGQGWQAIVERSKNSRWIGLFSLILLLAFNILKVIGRNNDWQSEYSLYKSALAVNQRNGKLYNNMGQVYESMNRYEEALQHYRTAMNIESSDTRSYLNAGRILTLLRRYGEAEDIYRQAKTLFPVAEKKELYVTPSHLQVFLHLASLISQNESRLEEADALYREAITLRSDFTNAYLNRGDVLLKMNKSKEAESMYHRAIQFDESNPDLHFNLGIVLMDQGKNTEALEQFNKALDIEPDHEKSLELSAILMQESNNPRHKYLARARLERIVDRGKETERVYINLGLVAVENRNFQSAEKWFRKALEKDSVSKEGLFNLALLLSESERESEAIIFLHKLLQHYPGHVNGLLLLADINVNYLRNLDAAEECYRKVLKLDSSNQKAQHNLCVVHFERQDFKRAESCFAHTLSVHPDVQYIQQHLDIVRNILSEGQKSVLEHFSNPHSIS
ncbi:protein O-mannosyl-transferase TMTC3 [Parasteatoda tepidariorum]|uniref:protein O-mannosyl-transferase TMTC3 n=1 Tax=Parasteatoda tepidariorum TaxID=114398 RepID=UPI001C71FA00|nr:protein O-mannosyl-transferase TMTC3 [Parasteatoda tepidariorum]XP_042904984.1 protein O-mannosyl-transferase TMTC3 [Parasteatoda tepidariorum]